MRFMPCLLVVVRFLPSGYQISSSTAVIFYSSCAVFPNLKRQWVFISDSAGDDFG